MEDAAFLWSVRDAAVGDNEYALEDLALLDYRIEAHLDGLRVAGPRAWERCLAALDSVDPGRAFNAAVLALSSDDGGRLAQLLDIASQARGLLGATSSAFGWVEANDAKRWLQPMLRARAPIYRELGIRGFAMHRIDPGPGLTALCADSDGLTLMRALRTVGELRRRDLVGVLRAQFSCDWLELRSWALWSAVLIGDASALPPLAELIRDAPSLSCPHAMQLAFRAMDLAHARHVIKALAQDRARLPDAVTGCGISADPLYIPWLMGLMSDPELARKAGEAFCMITGVNLRSDGLAGDPPRSVDPGVLEDDDGAGRPGSSDADLDWPNPRLVREWWELHSGHYRQGTRYLAGGRVDRDHCLRILKEGYQKQRAGAAYELALIDGEAPLFEWRAPGFRQRRILGLGA